MAAVADNKPRSSARLGALMLATVVLAGWINLLPTGGVFPATVLVDVLTAAMIWLVITDLLRKDAPHVESWMLALFVLLVAYVVASIVSYEPLGDRFLVVRSSCLYAFVSVFIAIRLRAQADTTYLKGVTVALGVFLALFGIAQSYLSLPTALLTPKDSMVFSYFGTDIVRSNGLVGNTIVYGVTLTLIFAALLARAVATHGQYRYLPPAIVLIGIYTTNSRAALIGAAAVAAFVLIASRQDLRQSLGRIFTFAGGLGVLGALAWCIPSVWNSITSSFIVQELFLGRNISVQGSNRGHREDITLAIDRFKENPIWGHGVGSVGEGSIDAVYGKTITDGAFWARLAEGGIMLTAAWLAVILTVSAACWRAWRASNRTNWVALGVLGFSVYQFGFAAFVNSGWFGKTPFVMYWVLFGLAMAIERQRQQAEPEPRPSATQSRQRVRP